MSTRESALIKDKEERRLDIKHYITIGYMISALLAQMRVILGFVVILKD